jgi:RNA polymerase sigma factor (sigma-70 family)
VSRDASPESDLQLVRRFLSSRSEEAFRALYRVHTPALFALALRLTGGQEAEAEELVQECWVRAVGTLATFRAASAFRSWLCGLLINTRRERLRTIWRETGEPSPGTASAAPPIDLALDLERAIAMLPPGARDVFVLHDVEGYTHAEISALLDIASGTSKSQLARGRMLLRNALGYRDDAPPAVTRI